VLPPKLGWALSGDMTNAFALITAQSSLSPRVPSVLTRRSSGTLGNRGTVTTRMTGGSRITRMPVMSVIYPIRLTGGVATAG
jgi:hypothetical protein